MTDDRILDVRAEPPVGRQAVIFETIEALDAGADFELVNDHDPKPLHCQFAAEPLGAFTWECIEKAQRSGGSASGARRRRPHLGPWLRPRELDR